MTDSPKDRIEEAAPIQLPSDQQVLGPYFPFWSKRGGGSAGLDFRTSCRCSQLHLHRCGFLVKLNDGAFDRTSGVNAKSHSYIGDDSPTSLVNIVATRPLDPDIDVSQLVKLTRKMLRLRNFGTKVWKRAYGDEDALVDLRNEKWPDMDRVAKTP